jgi:hypothetical protein
MRRWDWVARLHDAIDAAAAHPFDYGAHNCALFAAECIDAILEDSAIAAELRPRFATEAEAKTYLTTLGGFEKAVTMRLGEPVRWPQAMRGDVCLMPTQDGPGLGVCVGDTVAMLSPLGVSHLKIDKALAVWRVE